MRNPNLKRILNAWEGLAVVVGLVIGVGILRPVVVDSEYRFRNWRRA